MNLRVAGAQLPVGQDDIGANVAAIERALTFARDAGAHILLTPEGSLSGYTPHFDPRAVTDALTHVTGLARAAGVGLALGTCFVEPDDGRCYNQVRFYAPDGAWLGFHTKTLRCGTMAERPEGEINDYAVRPLQTFDFLGVRVGALICNDLWANPTCTPMPDPHLTQQLSALGARVVFHAVNGGRDGSALSDLCWQFHESNLRLRALAGHLWIVTVDNCAPLHLPCSAPSGVIAPDGRWACQAESRGEQYFVHTIELGQD
jgi:predicted amidohydrolase